MSIKVDFKAAPPPRVGHAWTLMAQANMGSLVCGLPQNVYQFSNYNPIINSTPAFVILMQDNTRTDLVLLVPRLREPLALDTPGVPRICTYGDRIDELPDVSPWKGSTWQDAVASLVKGYPGKMGIEPHDLASLGSLEKLPNASLTDAKALITECRNIKDRDQIENACIAAYLSSVGVRGAEEALLDDENTGVDIFCEGTVAMLRDFQKNCPEVKICGFGSRSGGMLNGLGHWVLIGPERFYNCGPPSTRKPLQGEMVSLGFWVIVNGMYNETERSVWRGQLSAFEKQALVDIGEIQSKMSAAAKPGVACSALYEIYRVEMVERGYSKYIAFRCGHGTGLDPHEDLSLAPHNDTKVKKGNLITFEPHAILHPTLRTHLHPTLRTQISDVFLITGTGSVILTPRRGESLKDLIARVLSAE